MIDHYISFTLIMSSKEIINKLLTDPVECSEEYKTTRFDKIRVEPGTFQPIISIRRKWQRNAVITNFLLKTEIRVVTKGYYAHQLALFVKPLQ